MSTQTTTRLEGEIIDMFATALRADAGQIDPDSNYFTLGGDSLSTVNLSIAISDRYDIEFSLIEIFENPTPGGIAGVLADRYLN
ncbi:acyl carrier protein [Thalassococcus sp. BH17M4-6]|uniref:acyl carrier protein n=1 Tax=Thalassococcus sp. BH17M4-6 TaxID=3413148 RepID=UPI003BEC8897